MVRIFFCTDIHGAESVWKKFLNAGKYLKSGVLIMGGDITGKRIIPIIEQPNGTWRGIKYGWNNQELIMKTEREVKDFVEYSRSIGCYPCQLTPDENEEISSPESVFIKMDYQNQLREDF